MEGESQQEGSFSRQLPPDINKMNWMARSPSSNSHINNCYLLEEGFLCRALSPNGGSFTPLGVNSPTHPRYISAQGDPQHLVSQQQGVQDLCLVVRSQSQIMQSHVDPRSGCFCQYCLTLLQLFRFVFFFKVLTCGEFVINEKLHNLLFHINDYRVQYVGN